jgi:hypothetical protein
MTGWSDFGLGWLEEAFPRTSTSPLASCSSEKQTSSCIRSSTDQGLEEKTAYIHLCLYSCHDEGPMTWGIVCEAPFGLCGNKLPTLPQAPPALPPRQQLPSRIVKMSLLVISLCLLQGKKTIRERGV